MTDSTLFRMYIHSFSHFYYYDKLKLLSFMSASQPSIETLAEAAAIHQLSRIRDRNRRATEPIECAIAANALLSDGKITIGHDFICPLSQMIPEDPVSFGGGVYKRELVEGYVKESLTKVLPRRDRIKRHVRDPLNPGRIIYTKPGDGSTVTDNTQMENILTGIF